MAKEPKCPLCDSILKEEEIKISFCYSCKSHFGQDFEDEYSFWQPCDNCQNIDICSDFGCKKELKELKP